MENVIELYTIDIYIMKLTDWIRKMARVVLIVLLFVCLYVNCAMGMRQIQAEAINKRGEQIRSIPVPSNDMEHKVLKMLKTLPYKDVSYNYKDMMIFPNVLTEGTLEEDIGNKYNKIEEDEMAEIGNSVVSKEEESIQDENVGGQLFYPKVIVHGNGGFPETTEIQLDTKELVMDSLEKPKRLGKEFDNWYVDPGCTIPFNGSVEETETVNIYAGWREFGGFTSNDEGLITGYTDSSQITFSGELVLPTNEACLGVQDGALLGVEDLVEGVYIPKNIVSLPEGVFDKFSRLMYIHVDQGNPVYKSINGVLYNIDNTLVCAPPGQIINE